MEQELIVKWKVKQDALPKILKLLPILTKASKEESGNVLYSVYQSATDPTELYLHESYLNEDALEEHKRSTHYQGIVVEEIIPNLITRELAFVNKIF